MPILKTPIDGLLLFEPQIWEDDRGFFYESFNKKNFVEYNITNEYLQDNQSYSSYGVIRGLHYQYGVHAQAKLVSVLQGTVLDVVVDMRHGSSTYGTTYSVELSQHNKLQLYVPRGFAHGFAVLSTHALFYYKCDNYYNKTAEGGIHLQDNDLNIDWRIPLQDMIISEKDKLLPNFKDCEALS